MLRRGRIYKKGNYWIRVRKASESGGFIAATNNFDVHNLIHQELNYRNTSEEAQEDLDNFAIHHNLEEVTEQDKRG